MRELILSVDGMSCQHCVMRVRRFLEPIPGIGNLTVDIGKVSLSYDENRVRPEEIEKAIVTAGYTIRT